MRESVKGFGPKIHRNAIEQRVGKDVHQSGVAEEDIPAIRDQIRGIKMSPNLPIID